MSRLMFYALNKISMDQPNWTFVAARAFLNELYDLAAKNRGYDPSHKYADFYALMKTLTEKGNLFSRFIGFLFRRRSRRVSDGNQSRS